MTTITDIETRRVENGQTIIEKGGRTYVVMPDGLRRWTDTRYEREPWENPPEEFYDASWNLVRICRDVGAGRSARRQCGTPEQMQGTVFDALGTMFSGVRDGLTPEQSAERFRADQARRNMSQAVVDGTGNVVPNDRAMTVAKHVRMARMMGIGGPVAGIGLGWAAGGKTGAIVGGILGAIAGAWGYMDHMEQGEIASRPAEPVRVPTGGIPIIGGVQDRTDPVAAKQIAPVVERTQPGPSPVATLQTASRPRTSFSHVVTSHLIAAKNSGESSRADTVLRLVE